VTESEQIELVASRIVEAAFAIHQEFGPGLLESVYEAAMFVALCNLGLIVAAQVPIVVSYQGVELGVGFRADLIVEDLVIVEIKSVEALHPVHPKQLLTYLKVTGKKLGLLINFSERIIKNGIKRIVNGL
jgi:GxxExxY protein